MAFITLVCVCKCLCWELLEGRARLSWGTLSSKHSASSQKESFYILFRWVNKWVGIWRRDLDERCRLGVISMWTTFKSGERWDYQRWAFFILDLLPFGYLFFFWKLFSMAPRIPFYFCCYFGEGSCLISFVVVVVVLPSARLGHLSFPHKFNYPYWLLSPHPASALLLNSWPIFPTAHKYSNWTFHS